MAKLACFLVALALASAKPSAEIDPRNLVVIHGKTDLYKVGPEEISPEAENCIESEKVEFKLSAIGLPNTDPFDGSPDAYVEISGSLNFKSGHVDDTNNPSWPDVFTVFYVPDTVQVMDVHVMDYDPIGPDDEIGWVKGVEVKSILECTEQGYQIEGGGGYLVFHRYNCPENVTTNAN